MSEIGKRIKALREKEGVTQRQMAHHSNLSQGTIGNIEAGISLPNYYTLIDFADYFQVSLDDLVGRNPWSINI
ncbi:helix-turn-helix transcriptional regulator [Fructobacillus sp. CRL 2054]|uniref:helix-turn-helix domain-containing protein n=1 Tax=Fructobacillus sp. CRL 2054 TaxID=2763007 RepID=UPI0023786F91|nr:helix-turn-helix transcriptional regulator [Fructobacillus sp. CRL 2054]MDD9139168.1 helix-turn-helix transcriptional regulator [Fructobacillus sp. CRL 2054]